MPKVLEFFFDYASPYSYLASTQLEALTARTGCTLSWRPFLLGAVFKSVGKNSPPGGTFAQAKYQLKDLQDWSDLYGLPPFVLPAAFPMNGLKADRLGLVALAEGQIAAFTRAVYRRAFTQGQDVADPALLEAALAEAGLPVASCLARADAQETKDLLRKNTDEAVERGAFGAPTFFIGEDMYVGNDRLGMVERALRAGT